MKPNQIIASRWQNLLCSKIFRSTRYKQLFICILLAFNHPGFAQISADTPISDANRFDPSLHEGMGGTFEHQVIIDGTDREFIVYVPNSAFSLHNLPVVFMFHGTGGSGERFLNISGWKEKADQEGFIVVFPSALAYCYHEDVNFDGLNDEIRTKTKWAAGQLGALAMPLCTPEELSELSPIKSELTDHPVNDDIAFVDEMLEFVKTNYRVNPKRIYATGFSNGGNMTIRLAVERSDQFAAISSSAGLPNIEPIPATRAVPFVYTVGNQDPAGLDRYNRYLETPLDSVPVDGTLLQTVPEFNRDMIVPLLSVLQLQHNYTNQQQTLNGVLTDQYRYTTPVVGSVGSNSLNVVVIDGLDHHYPNGIKHPVVMADYLWDFFIRHELP